MRLIYLISILMLSQTVSARDLCRELLISKESFSEIKVTGAGPSVISKALKSVAFMQDEIIVVRAINPGALRFYRDDDESSIAKPRWLHLKSIRSGAGAGLIPLNPQASQSGLTRAELNVRNKEVAKNISKGRLTVRNIEGVEVLTDLNGRPIVSDLDVWGIGRRGQGHVTYQRKTGWNIDEDVATVDMINQLIGKKIVVHGSWIAQPEEGASDYPLEAYVPNNKPIEIRNDRELVQFLSSMKVQGYDFPGLER